MNINKISPLGFIRPTGKGQAPGKVPRAGGRDDMVLSGAGKSFANALKAAKDLPEVNEEKVARISHLIKTGRYEVSPDKLAKKILGGEE